MGSEEYLLDNRAAEAGGRFDALSAIFDPVTFRHVDALGIAPGWRCWDVGAGGPSVPDGLAARVGSTGRVGVAADGCGAAARGRLLVEDYDISLQTMICPDVQGPDQLLANKVKDGFRSLLSERGVDAEFGRRLPRLLRQLGLDVSADAYFPLAVSAVGELERANVVQVRDGLVARGYATGAEVDAYLALIDAGKLDLATAPLVSAAGRRG